jgi:hypothetical protein
MGDGPASPLGQSQQIRQTFAAGCASTLSGKTKSRAQTTATNPTPLVLKDRLPLPVFTALATMERLAGCAEHVTRQPNAAVSGARSATARLRS